MRQGVPDDGVRAYTMSTGNIRVGPAHGTRKIQKAGRSVDPKSLEIGSSGNREIEKSSERVSPSRSPEQDLRVKPH